MDKKTEDLILLETLNKKITDLSLIVRIVSVSTFITDKIKGYGFEVLYDDKLIGRSPCHFKSLKAAHKAALKWFRCFHTGVKE